MTELPDARRKRSFAIWAISLSFLYEGIGPIITPFILQSGLPLPPPSYHICRTDVPLRLLPVLASWRTLRLWGLALLRLQKIAIYLLPIGGAGRMALNLWAFTKFDVEPTPSLIWIALSVGLLVVLGLGSLLFVYLSRLTKKGILN
jgi:hypothetical protein